MFWLLPVEICKVILSNMSYYDYLRVCKAYPDREYLTDIEKLEFYPEYRRIKGKERLCHDMVQVVHQNNNLTYVKDLLRTLASVDNMAYQDLCQDMYNSCNICNMPKYYHVAYNIPEGCKDPDIVTPIILLPEISAHTTCPVMWSIHYHICKRREGHYTEYPLMPQSEIYNTFRYGL